MAKKLFISYSHADAAFLGRLHKHLAQLKRDGSVDAWYDQEIQAGGKIDTEISRNLDNSDVFIAVLSPDFINSSYCYDIELKTALDMEQNNKLVVVPLIFRPCEWLETPLAKFKALPTDGKAVSEYFNEDVALLSVTSDIRRLIMSMQASEPAAPKFGSAAPPQSVSSRYRVRRDFDKIDKRDFLNRSFEEIRRFFDSSVSEVNTIPEIEASIRDRDLDSFSCTVINRGMGRAFETLTIRRGGSGFGDISIVYGEDPSPRTSNGGFTIEAGDYELFWTSGLYSFHSSRQEKMSAQDVAKILWDDLLKKVGVDYA